MVRDPNQHFAEPLSTLQVIEIDPQSDSRWEAFVTALPDGLIYHHPAWLQVLQETFGYTPAHLACEDDHGQIRGVLPLFYQCGLFTGRRFASLPRTPLAGPLAYDDEAAAVLVRAAVERARGKSGAGLQIKVLSNALDRLVDGVVSVPWRATYVLDLPEHPELLHLDAPIKRAINKASRLGVQVSPAESERDLQDWYELYLRTMRWVTVPPRPYHFFEVAWKRLQPLGLMRLLLAKRYQAGQTQVLGGLLLLMFGQTVFYAFSGWRRDDQSVRPNDALHWQAIQDACAEGFRYYDLGEVTKNNQGLAEFKSKWGAEAKWLYRYYYPAPRELEADMLESNSRSHQLMAAVWRRLPIKATVVLSDLAHHYF